MATLHHDVKRAVDEGFASIGPQNPYLATSSCWEGWEIGRYLRETGRSTDGLKKGRGNLYKTAFAAFRISMDRKGFVSISKVR